MNFRVTLPKPLQSATLSYWVKFSKDYDWTRGGKLPGLSSNGLLPFRMTAMQFESVHIKFSMVSSVEIPFLNFAFEELQKSLLLRNVACFTPHREQSCCSSGMLTPAAVAHHAWHNMCQKRVRVRTLRLVPTRSCMQITRWDATRKRKAGPTASCGAGMQPLFEVPHYSIEIDARNHFVSVTHNGSSCFSISRDD